MNRRQAAITQVALLAAIAIVYGQTLGFGFVNADDPRYITQNPQVLRGIDAQSVRWALGATHAANWHPVTWLSHMLDVELYGERAGGHHLSNVLLHAANASLLFWILALGTGAMGRSAVVALVFALHPLAVESVAWVSERKNLLSTLFGLLATAAYLGYARRGGVLRHLLTGVGLALSLMAKPMLVTLPFIFLLLDYWPLGRLRRSWQGRPLGEAANRVCAPRPIRSLVLEKLPWFGLSLASCGITLWAQAGGGAIRTIEALPLLLRLENAVVSTVRYIGMWIWPSGLTLLYPHPDLAGSGADPLAGWQVAASAALLIVISVGVWKSGRAYAHVGWAWYLGTLAPVIGVVQVGMQSHADRYTYVPLIGLGVATCWGVEEFLKRTLPGRGSRVLARALSVAACVTLAAMSYAQAQHWQSSRTLFSRAADLAPRSAVIQLNYGLALRADAELEGAIARYQLALDLQPALADAHVAMGSALRAVGRLDEAVKAYRNALAIEPESAEAHFNFANALRDGEQFRDALTHYERAESLNPELDTRTPRAATYFAWGNALYALGRDADAAERYQRVLAIDPDHARARYQLAQVERAQAAGRSD